MSWLMCSLAQATHSMVVLNVCLLLSTISDCDLVPVALHSIGIQKILCIHMCVHTRPCCKSQAQQIVREQKVADLPEGHSECVRAVLPIVTKLHLEHSRASHFFACPTLIFIA